LSEINQEALESNPKVLERLRLIETMYRSEWIDFIRSCDGLDRPVRAIQLFELFISPFVPTSDIVRSVRELVLYYARPGTMPDLTRYRVRSDISLIFAMRPEAVR
jgi:hypothetical protein